MARWNTFEILININKIPGRKILSNLKLDQHLVMFI